MDYTVLRKAMTAVRDLPTLPVVVERVNKVVNDPNADVAKLASVISSDQSIAVRVLKLVNSAFYGHQKTNDIQKAVTRIGFRTVSQLVTNVAICNMFKEDKGSQFERYEFWRHSIAVAVLSKMLAAQSKQAGPEEAFTCGLLHDIGKVILDQYLHPEMVIVVNHAAAHKKSFYRSEKDTIRIDHTVIGEMAAKAWLLPIQVLVSIRHHHSELSERRGMPSSDDVMVDIVRLADFIARDMHVGASGDHFPPEWTPSMAGRLSLPEGAMEKIREACLPEIDRCSDFIDLPKRRTEPPVASAR